MTVRIKRVRIAGALAMALGAIAPASARGQTVDQQRGLAAQALYAQATAEMDAGNYATACPKLEEVTKIVPEGLGAKMTLGQCYEARRLLASAWSQYALVESLAAKAGQEERSRTAGEKAAELKPKLATLAVEVPSEVRSIPGLAITRDGVPLGDAQWGLPLPIDAGAHEITVTAPGRKAWSKRAEVSADGVPVVVQVEAPAVIPSAAATSSVAPKRGPMSVVDGPRERPWQRPIAIGAMGLGVMGVGVGAVLGGLALSKNGASNRDNHCDAQNTCDPTGIELRKEAVGLANATTGVIVAGAAVLAGGIVLFATAPASGVKQERAGAENGRWSAKVVLLPSGARVSGAW
jgi:hypothetical protein